MPCFDYICEECGTSEPDVIVSTTEERICSSCGAAMKRLFPTSSHTMIGTDIDSKNTGNKVREKNEKLKKMHAGYQYEEQNMRKEINKQIAKLPS